MVEVSNSHSAVFDRTCELSCWSPPSNPETSSSDKMDPVLELWIDDNAVPIKVRLAGLLDAGTGAAVRSVIGELLAEGHRDFALEIDGLSNLTRLGFPPSLPSNARSSLSRDRCAGPRGCLPTPR